MASEVKRVPLLQAIHFKGVVLGLQLLTLFLEAGFGTYTWPVQVAFGAGAALLGGLNLRDCPLQPLIPFYLVAYGLLLASFSLARRFKPNRWLELGLGICLFGASLAFAVLIALAGRKARHGEGYCDKVVFHASAAFLCFWLTLTTLFLLTFVVVWTFNAALLFARRVKAEDVNDDGRESEPKAETKL